MIFFEKLFQVLLNSIHAVLFFGPSWPKRPKLLQICKFCVLLLWFGFLLYFFQISTIFLLVRWFFFVEFSVSSLQTLNENINKYCCGPFWHFHICILCYFIFTLRKLILLCKLLFQCWLWHNNAVTLLLHCCFWRNLLYTILHIPIVLGWSRNIFWRRFPTELSYYYNFTCILRNKFLHFRENASLPSEKQDMTYILV